MSTYRHETEFYDDTTRLITEGASLRDLYNTMLTVERPDMSAVDTSPKRLRTLAQSWLMWPHFVGIRLAELFAGAEVEHTDDYVLAMIGHLGGRKAQDIRAHMLRHDTELREEIFWRVFEVEGGGEISLANIDKYSGSGNQWHRTVVLLTQEGTLDRARVLRSCLAALTRDFSSYRAGWFSRVYADLAATPQEAAVDQDLLRLALGTGISATVTLAVKQLTAVHKAGLLDGAALVDASAPTFGSSKAAATSMVRLLTALAGSGDVAPDAVADALVVALGHEHPDVQRAAARALVGLGREELVHEHRETLAPAVAAELAPIAPAASGGAGSSGSRADGATGAGVASATRPTAAHPSAVASAPLVAWSDDDAALRFSLLLENTGDALEAELALAWLATTANAGTVLALLATRASKIDASHDAHWLANLVEVACDPSAAYLPQTFYQGVRNTLVNGVWTEKPEGPPVARRTAEESTMVPSLVLRLREVASILQGRAPRRRLLATPTDAHGWVDAQAFGERYASQSEPFAADLAQALLRLRPADRDTVLTAHGLAAPETTNEIRVEWHGTPSKETKRNGEPEWVSWVPTVHASELHEPDAARPGLIHSGERAVYGSWRATSPLVIGQLAIHRPGSPVPLAAACAGEMYSEVDEAGRHHALPILTALESVQGGWGVEAGQLVALGMAAKIADVRAKAVEVFAAAVPARLSVEDTAAAFDAVSATIVLTRWGSAFTDAATIAPETAVAVLTQLLPRIDRGVRGVGSLVTVLLDESLRLGTPVTDGALREWLGGFSGASAAAKAARALLAMPT